MRLPFLVILLAAGCRPEAPAKLEDTGEEPLHTSPPCDKKLWYTDADWDGWGDPGSFHRECEQPPGTVDNAADCDDTTAAVAPYAEERCNGVDDDCDTVVDEADAVGAPTWHEDADGDGFGDPATTAPGCLAPEGFVGDATDCDALDGAVHPGAEELCNTIDDDCDGEVDTDTPSPPAWYRDRDEDGYGYADAVTYACEAPWGSVADGTDCEDAVAEIHPGADEVCNYRDDDCSGVADESDAIDATTWYPDADGDGYGDPTGVVTLACREPAATSSRATDCDDADAAVHELAREVCNGVDDDCDGTADGSDAADATAWYVDADGDGYGDDGSAVWACSAPTDTIATGGDCDDADPAWSPATPDVCGDGVDENCDGLDRCDPTVEVALSSADAWMNDGWHLYGGRALATGDTDGDGDADLLVGEPGYCDGESGGAHVVHGPHVSGSTPASVLALDGCTVAYTGATGTAVALGDTDGDGAAELVVGSPYGGYYSNHGYVHVLSGGAAPATLASYYGELEWDEAGKAVATGDLDGDGLADLVIGADHDEAGGREGAAYVAYAPHSGTRSPLASADIRLLGDPDSLVGLDVDAGDLDGDGLDDLLVRGADTVYLLVAPPSGALTLAEVDVRISAHASTGTVASLVTLGDLDGDGALDLVVSAAADDTAGSAAGAVYLYLAAPAVDTDLSAADGVLLGTVADGVAGYSVATGDLDADGEDDLLIGQPGLPWEAADTGRAWAWLGATTGTWSLGDADATFAGASLGDAAGYAVAIGDLTDDGLPEVIVGAPYASSRNGVVYVTSF